jgi:hypothetical protein
MENTFLFDKKQYEYTFFREGEAYANEKTIELPIFEREVRQGGSVLEVGNVLKKYYPDLNHIVLDKSTKGKGIINKDVFEFWPKKQYDLVVSVSTVLEPDKLIPTIESMKLLGKRVLISVPLGYSAELDGEIQKIKDGRFIVMKRISRENRWVEHHGFGQNMRYGYPFENGNWMAFVEFRV